MEALQQHLLASCSHDNAMHLLGIYHPLQSNRYRAHYQGLPKRCGIIRSSRREHGTCQRYDKAQSAALFDMEACVHVY